MSEVPASIKHMNEKLELRTGDHSRSIMAADPEPTVGSPDTGLPLERLEERICELAAHLAAGTCQFLQLVAEFDARRGWRGNARSPQEPPENRYGSPVPWPACR
jgi:hypothetical protein